jgi:hypothetical protein
MSFDISVIKRKREESINHDEKIFFFFKKKGKKKFFFLDVYGLIFMCHHGLHTHASSVRVAGKVLDARTAETADSVGTSRIGATRLTQAFVNV